MALNRTSQSNEEGGADEQVTTSSRNNSTTRKGVAKSIAKEISAAKKIAKRTGNTDRDQSSTRQATTKRNSDTKQIQDASDSDLSVTTTVRPARVQRTTQSATSTSQVTRDTIGLQISFSVPIVAGLDSAPSL